MAKKLSTDFKLSVRTSRRVHEAFSHLVIDAAAEGVKFNGRKIGAEAALNAVLLDFLDKPEEEQLAILKRNVLRFQVELAGDPDEPPVPVVLTGQAARDAIAASQPGKEPPIVVPVETPGTKPKSGPTRRKA